MIATSQQESEELGLITYMDGKECRNGHNGRKYTVNRACVECTAERGARRNRRNPPLKMRQSGQKTMDDWALIKEIEEAEKEIWE